MSDDRALRAFISRILISGGDRRITVPPGGGANVYGATPYPRDVSAYAASTANDISSEAFDHLCAVVQALPIGPMTGENYARALDALRDRLRTAMALPGTTEIVFAPSGTDLEYAALALAQGRSGQLVHNILLGADEVGSGCLAAAGGRFFAAETALAPSVEKGAGVVGLEAVTVEDIPVRCPGGVARSSAVVAGAIDDATARARAIGRHALVHIVHGSKTGLIRPDMAEVDALRARHGDSLTLVVDACQARLEAGAIRNYLDRGAIVFLTGSKFIGGPPFSGFALIPPGLRAHAPLPHGFSAIFRRSEWPGANDLDASSNLGLLLRLEAALFELERFAALSLPRRRRVIAAFGAGVAQFSAQLGAPLIGPLSDDLSLERATLATIDITRLPGRPDFAVAQRWQRVLAARGMRLGQPVKCIPLADGGWGGTLRISLSMPLIVSLDRLDDAALAARFARDMGQIADILLSAARPVAA